MDDVGISTRDYLLALLERQREEMLQRIEAVAHRIDATNEAQQNALTLALTNVEKAVHKTDEAVERRFASVNEFRQALTDQTHTFIPRSEYTVQIKALSERADVMSQRMAGVDTQLAAAAGKSQGFGTAGGLFYAVIIAASAIIGIFLSVFLRTH